MAEVPFQIPPDIINWIRTVFAGVNRRVSEKLTRVPTSHETSLDITLIEELSRYVAPFRFLSNWIVQLETHYLGGGRYWGRWEIADIGVLVIFRRGGITQQTKIALLQSKRLYPVEAQSQAEDHPIDYEVGFGDFCPQNRNTSHQSGVGSLRWWRNLDTAPSSIEASNTRPSLPTQTKTACPCTTFSTIRHHYRFRSHFRLKPN